MVFLHPLETSEIQNFSNVSKGYKKRPVAWDELNQS